MTKVGRLFEEEKQQAVKEAVKEALQQGMQQGIYEKELQVYNNMIARGYSEEEARAISGFPK